MIVSQNVAIDDAEAGQKVGSYRYTWDQADWRGAKHFACHHCGFSNEEHLPARCIGYPTRFESTVTDAEGTLYYRAVV